MMIDNAILLLLSAALLSACSAPLPRQLAQDHLVAKEKPAPASGSVPSTVDYSLAWPTLYSAPKAETYSVAVNGVPVHELLFALARDAKLDVDIHPGIVGAITLNAVDQTLPQLLARIARQIDMRFEIRDRQLSVMPDTPFLKHYTVDYVNMARNVSSAVSTSMQIAAGNNTGGTPAPSASLPQGGNVSSTRIDNLSRNQFWESLEKNLKDILRETDKTLPDGSSETQIEQSSTQNATGSAALPYAAGQRHGHSMAQALQSNPNPASSSQATGNSLIRRSTFREAASVILNAEAGLITVRATQRQHERIQEFLDRVVHSARRQVLIEATIVEVMLKDGYQQGINWTQLASGGSLQFIGGALTQNTANLQYARSGNPDALITLLNTYGTTKVLSSPRISVLNNQTALLKVVENYVYFSVKADTTSTANVGTSTTYTTTPQSVSVGLVVSVTPQISDTDIVTMNVRPTVTSVAREIADPNPDLVRNNINNYVPVIRTREIESIMRVASGNTAILGGLMEDRIDYQNQRVPLIGQLPLAGELFNNRNNQLQKTELVIFLRPVVVRDASLDGEQQHLRRLLPEADFLDTPAEHLPIGRNPRS